MKKIYFATIISIFLLSCDKPFYCGKALGIETSSSLLIYPFNTGTNNYFSPVVENQSTYKKDSLIVLKEDGNLSIC
jgi:hypothetical protein